MDKSLISEMVREAISREISLEPQLEESFSDDVRNIVSRSIDTIKGAVTGGVGGAAIGGVAAGILLPLMWGLGLTNPLTAMGIGIFSAAKLGMAAGIAYGSYIGATGQLTESCLLESDSQFTNLSNKAVATVKARDEMLKKASQVVAREGDLPLSYNQQLNKTTSDMQRSYTDVKRYVVANRDSFKRDEYDVIIKICDIAIKGKLTYLKDKK